MHASYGAIPQHLKLIYLTMSLMIKGSRQPNNDINVYLEPLFDDVLKLWNQGVNVQDEHM